jgi:hypothetical protein
MMRKPWAIAGGVALGALAVAGVLSLSDDAFRGLAIAIVGFVAILALVAIFIADRLGRLLEIYRDWRKPPPV